ncbi:imidazole glycerol phosphate synthase subunit HisH [Leptospira sp. 201903071]|uniref:imidazole glycerol phosphate synthase subunit HisH n=1 Tax=Leptospira ainazelensis TaxID=2810034 RepID=UPI00196582BD|nr:imidazole glycerol phosphate synthase subunit HisH [Leptospira ainazelensis]MBM9501950.1 imidazole glycerol phosphate synthase subunit HisH [Leptospira ainazelensis]
MKKEIVVIDYGIGNLFSVKRSFESCGANVVLTSDFDRILAADHLVLPGVGAFADGMNGLKKRGLDKAIVEYAKTGKPLLGICLGMQMLATTSQEFGSHKGLDLVPGKVIAIENTSADGKPHKIPHIGWEDLVKPNEKTSWDHTILKSIPERSAVYHIHSFTFFPDAEIYRLADCFYNGKRLSSVIRKENVYGCQFHPEKSGKIGLEILKNFLYL